jgi:hypothetical protein
VTTPFRALYTLFRDGYYNFGGSLMDSIVRVLAETEREKGKKALLALASERRAA